MALYQSVADIIGNTPLVHISNFEKAFGLAANALTGYTKTYAQLTAV